MKFFFKPIGTKESKIGLGYGINDPILFSDKPSLQKGDWLFLYAVGLQKMIGISVVAEDNPIFESDNTRFKYGVSACHVLPAFSKDWYDIALNPLQFDDDFTAKTGFNVTLNKDSLSGALQAGNTKFEISQAFAFALFEKMAKLC